MPLDKASLVVGVALGGVGLALARLVLLRRRRPSGQLWASPLTTCSRRVIVACIEAGIDFSFVPIHLAKGEHKLPQMIALNPYGKVPAWRDASGFDLFESRAIMRHVCEGTALIPSAAGERAVMDQWLWVDQCAFYPAFIPIFYMRVIKVMPLDEAACAAKTAELAPTLDAMETRLKNSAYLAGPAFTLADLTYLCYFEVFGAAGLQALLDARPALAAWSAACRKRPSWQHTLSQQYVVERALPADPLGRAKPWNP